MAPVKSALTKHWIGMQAMLIESDSSHQIQSSVLDSMESDFEFSLPPTPSSDSIVLNAGR